MKSIFADLPNHLIMRIIREATQMDILDYQQRIVPPDFIMKYTSGNIIIKKKSELINSFPEYKDPNTYILLPRSMRGQYYKGGKSRSWCQPFSKSLLHHTMSDDYWDMVKRRKMILNKF